MENPFTKLGEVIHAGFEKLHNRVGGVERDFSEFKDKIEADVEIVSELKDRLAKVEALLDVKAISAATDKVASAGSDGTASADAPKPDATAPTIAYPTPTTIVAVVPAAASDPAIVATPIGAVTVQPGTTVHVDDSAQPNAPAVTTVPHDGSDATATTASGADVAPDPVVVAAAKVATADAGVTVPASAQ